MSSYPEMSILGPKKKKSQKSFFQIGQYGYEKYEILDWFQNGAIHLCI
jgi:hypothetical protein